MTKLCVIGPTGRMGGAVLRAAQAKGITVVSALDRKGVSGPPDVPTTDDANVALAAASVYIDFSTPLATRETAEVAARHKVAAVVGTTGLDDKAEEALDALAQVAPVLCAPNFSLGVNLLLALAEQAAQALGDDYDLEVFDMHHRNKLDAPSGTALALAEALATGRGLSKDSVVRTRKSVTAPRGTDEVGIAALRAGDVIGDHTAFLVGPEERLELTHRASSRQVFASGAVRAAAWLDGKAPGRYSMRSVLGL